MSSLESAIRILHCLSPETPHLRVSELAQRLNIPKSTVSRLLRTLSDGGVLDRNENTKEYAAGPVALQLGGLYMARHDLLHLVDEAVRKLVERFGFTGYVAVLDRAEAVVLRCREGGYPVKFLLEVGTRQPAAEAALGIGLLARLNEAELRQVLEAPRYDDSYIHPPVETTLGWISEFRRQGWVEVPCVSAPEIAAIGAVVDTPPGGQQAIGFSLSFPVSAADAAIRQLMATQIREVALELSSIATSVSAPFAGRPGARYKAM